MMQDLIYYVNGSFVPASEATLPLNDLGLVRGYGVFDFLRTYHGRSFHLMDHLLRLKTSAEQIMLSLPHDLEEIAAIVEETLARNGLPEANIRLIVTGGPSSNFFMPEGPGTLAVMVSPASRYPDHFFSEGTAVVTTRLGRELPTVKSLNYIGAIVAMKQAAAAGAVEALYVDDRNRISEGTRANFFVVKDGRLISPGDRVLPGITRSVLLRLIRRHLPALQIEERAIDLEEMRQVDEAFLTSSTKEVMPVVRVDEVIVGDGRVGPLTRRLMALFRAYAEDQLGEAEKPE